MNVDSAGRNLAGGAGWSKGKSRVILIAEPDAGLRMLLAHLLRQSGYEPVSMPAHRDLLKYLDAAQSDGENSPAPVVILSALWSGYRAEMWDTLRAWRQVDPETPVIVITPRADANIEDQAQQVGATVVERPVRWPALRYKIERLTETAAA